MHLLVANPTAQSGKNVDRIERARALLHDAGVEHDFLATAPAGETVSLVAAALRRALDAGVLRAFGEDGELACQDLFFDSAGWGLSPRVLAQRNEDRRFIEEVPFLRDVWRDQLVYAGALVKSFMTSVIED